MSGSPKCSKCGAELAPDAPGGHCMRCLLLLALDPPAPLEPAESEAPQREDHSGEPEFPEVANYKVIQKIGEGGCGVVYLAERLQPIRLEVALKVIKLGMDTRQVITRFEAERQALALMDHPNIAKVVDAGATTTGRLFFAMELVRGVPITTYCDRNSLGIRERIELFSTVCRAIQHAHQKGVIHRDIKPSNILVFEQDGRPTPKVIDFGIAKATGGQRLADATLFTAFEQFIGTPAYMSPEQASSGVDIDTRSDVYSLGVLLYELLTGSPLYDLQELSVRALDEIRRCIREDDPLRPSIRLATMKGETLTAIATCRNTQAHRLPGTLRGDLDWIVMRALEKDRAHRYATVNDLTEDLRRYLGSEPVTARPPGTLYQLRKFARRNKIAVIATLAVAITLITATMISAWEAVEARKAENRALAEAAKNREIAMFLEYMLQGVQPLKSRGLDTTLMRELLDHAAVRIGIELKGVPEVEAPLRRTIGWSYHKIGAGAKAEANLRDAVRLFREQKDELNLVRSLNWLAMVILDKGGAFQDEAETLAREAYGLQLKLSPADTDALTHSQTALGGVLIRRGKLAEAEPVVRLWLERQRRVLGEKDPAIARSLLSLAEIEEGLHQLPLAEQHYAQAVAIDRATNEGANPGIAPHLSHLALARMAQKKYAEAEPVLLEACALAERISPRDLHFLQGEYEHLIDLYQGWGKPEQAQLWQKKLGNLNTSPTPAPSPAS